MLRLSGWSRTKGHVLQGPTEVNCREAHRSKVTAIWCSLKGYCVEFGVQASCVLGSKASTGTVKSIACDSHSLPLCPWRQVKTQEARSLGVPRSQQRFTSHTRLRLEPTNEWLVRHERPCSAGAHRSALQRSASKESQGKLVLLERMLCWVWRARELWPGDQRCKLLYSVLQFCTRNPFEGLDHYPRVSKQQNNGIRQVGFVPPALPFYRGRDISGLVKQAGKGCVTRHRLAWRLL